MDDEHVSGCVKANGWKCGILLLECEVKEDLFYDASVAGYSDVQLLEPLEDGWVEVCPTAARTVLQRERARRALLGPGDGICICRRRLCKSKGSVGSGLR